MSKGGFDFWLLPLDSHRLGCYIQIRYNLRSIQGYVDGENL